VTTPVQCEEHGDSVATFVCVHISQTLDDTKPRGFLWSVDDDGEYQAMCSDCDALSASVSEEEWERLENELCPIEILCLSCFKRAAKLNQINIPGT